MLTYKIPLTATVPLTYGTRRLQAGDTFEATPAHARVLRGIGKARDVRVALPEEPEAAPPEPVPPKAPGEDLESLRAHYETRFGQTPNKHWGAIRLRKALAGD